MAYDFTKNTANYLRWSTYNTFVNNYAGASNLIGSLWFRVRSVDSGVNCNRLMSAAIASGNTGFAAGVNSDGTVYAGFRSISTDSFEKHTTAKTVSIGGSEWNHLLFCVSFGTPGRIQLFLNGEWDSDRDGITFNSGVIAPTSQTTNFDYLGADAGGATPSNTTFQFDGQIGELAFWGIRHQSTNLPSLLTRMAKKAWYNKVTPLNTWMGISPYPYYRSTLDPTVVNGFGGRQAATDPAATTARNGVSNAYGHPPVQTGIHWRYRGRKSLILPTSAAFKPAWARNANSVIKVM